MCSMTSLDMDEIGCGPRLDLGKNSGLPQHDFKHLSTVLGEMPMSPGYFWIIWASDGGPSGHKGAVLSLLMWMRLDEVSNWIWIGV